MKGITFMKNLFGVPCTWLYDGPGNPKPHELPYTKDPLEPLGVASNMAVSILTM